jgi:hypothetical protein
MHDCEAGVHGSLSLARDVMVRVRGSQSGLQSFNARLRGGSACLQGCDAHVQRGSTRLHMSYARVHRVISVVHRQRRAQSVDSKGKSACLGRAAQRRITHAQGHCTSAQREIRRAATHARAHERKSRVQEDSSVGKKRQCNWAQKLLSCAHGPSRRA